MIEAIIFDMDGVIIDSEPLWRAAERQVFAGVGLILSDADCERTMGMRTDEVIRYWYHRSPWTDVEPVELEARLTEAMQSLIAERGRPMPGVDRALEMVRDAGRRMALASSSNPTLIEAVLRKLDLESTFEVVRSAHHEPLGKPHPAVFLSTARDLCLEPSQCAVVEDSAAGVQAARAAGMRVIAVPPPHLFSDPAYDRTDFKITSLDELTPSMLG